MTYPSRASEASNGNHRLQGLLASSPHPELLQNSLSRMIKSCVVQRSASNKRGTGSLSFSSRVRSGGRSLSRLSPERRESRKGGSRRYLGAGWSPGAYGNWRGRILSSAFWAPAHECLRVRGAVGGVHLGRPLHLPPMSPPAPPRSPLNTQEPQLEALALQLLQRLSPRSLRTSQVAVSYFQLLLFSHHHSQFQKRTEKAFYDHG